MIKEIDISLIDFSIQASHKFFDPELYHKLENQIRKNGQLKNILVEQQSNLKYKIVDGYYIAKILKDNGFKTIWVNEVKDSDLISFEMDLSFKWNYVKVAEKLKQMKQTEQEISFTTAMHPNEIKAFSRILEYDFSKDRDGKVHLDYNSAPNEEFF